MITDIVVIVWPDGTWCYEDELDQFSWKSDDFAKIHMLGDDWSDADLDRRVEEALLLRPKMRQKEK